MKALLILMAAIAMASCSQAPQGTLAAQRTAANDVLTEALSK